jgi:tRNA (guanine37-N1)-methyltransferase
MYRVGVVSLFPELVEPVVRHGVVGRARDRGLLGLEQISPREFATDRHRTVDDRPYGGGPGMVLKYEPMRDAIRAMRARLPHGTRELVLTAQGRPFDQALARELAAAPGMLLVSGRYEGIDERLLVAEVAAEVALGDFVLSGGELAAAVVIDAVARLLPGVLGDECSHVEDSYTAGLLDCPQYTRPEVADGMAVPAVLLGGDHEAIRRWRLKQALGRTWLKRPNMLAGRVLTPEESELLAEFKADWNKLNSGGEFA